MRRVVYRIRNSSLGQVAMGAALLFLVACGGTDPKPLPPGIEDGVEGVRPGQTSFEDELGNGSNRAEDDAVGAPTAGGDGQDNEAPPAPGGRMGEVEEADIYRIDNDRLFYFNTYRGFVSYDLSDPKNPKRISQLPVFGYPVEMFVDGNIVYALIRDALYLTQDKDKLHFQRHNVSQMLAIDVSDLANPRLLQTIDIQGELREGVSRKIEDTIYVVSYTPQYYQWGWRFDNNMTPQKEQAWVYSFNVSQPAQMTLMQKLQVFEGGSVNVYDEKSGASYNKSFSSVAISATSNVLMVVENWHTYASSPGTNQDEQWTCGSFHSGQQAIVSMIDISDPTGAIRLHSRFETSGMLNDQFKMTYDFDEASKTGTFFGIFARQAWSGENCQGQSEIRNTLESWDVSNGAMPTKLSSLDFGKPNETVRGSAFDVSRKRVYAITARQIDPLYTIDLSDRTNLRILSAIDNLSGDMNVFRLIGGGDYLIGIGRDNSEACAGFQDTENRVDTKQAVSIIDVRTPTAARLVQRACVSVKNADWVGSDINNNLDQAHKMIGMHSDGTANVLTVPVYYWKRSDENNYWWYSFETAVGLMSWDLGADDEATPPAQQDVIRNHGTVIHENGQVRRSVVFTHTASSRRMMVNLSDTHISIVDIEDLESPVNQSSIELAPYYNEIFGFGSFIVEHIQEREYQYWGAPGLSEFRVKPAMSDLEATAVVATLRIGQVRKTVRHGDRLLLFRQIPNSQNEGEKYTPPSNEVVVVDFSDPASPRVTGSTPIPESIMPYDYGFYCGVGLDVGGGYWFNQRANDWVPTAQGLVFMVQTWNQSSQRTETSLGTLAISAEGVPSYREQQLPEFDVVAGSRTRIDFQGFVADPDRNDGFFVAYSEWLSDVNRGTQTVTRRKSYVRRYQQNGTAWSPEASRNVPGTLIKTWIDDAGDRYFLTRDFQYIETLVPATADEPEATYWHPHSRLHLLRALPDSALAELRDARLFRNRYLSDLVFSGSKLFINAQPEYPWYGYGGRGDDGAVGGGVAVGGVAMQALETEEDPSARLVIIDLSQNTLGLTYDAPTGTSNVQLMGVHDTQLFVSLPGDGVMAIDVTNPQRPVGKAFLRTLGYATHIEFANNQAFVASGYFGIQTMPLTGGPAIPFE